MQNLTTSEIIASVAAGIALLSFIASCFSYAISKRALQLSQHEFNEKNLSVQAYLVDSFRFKRGELIFCSFAISYTNLASVPRSFSKLELEIEFTDEEGVYGKVIAPPDITEIPPGLNLGYKKLEIPINLGPKETLSGWVTFLLPLSLSRSYRIDSYTISGKMGDGHESNVEAYLLRLVENEEI